MNALTVKDLYKTYAGGKEALKGISFSVARGDFFSLLGPNGAGKSSTISILCSLIRKNQGTVNVFGYDLDKENLLVKSQIGMVPQEFNFSIFETCLEIVVNQAGFYGMSRKIAIERSIYLLKRLGMQDYIYKQARWLSGGFKRRLMIVRALVHQPRLLVLDEPTAGIDVEHRHEMWDLLKEINQNGTTIILTSHYLDEVEMLCRNVAIIDDGIIVKNTSIKKLVNEIQTEKFILDLQHPIETLPQISNYPMILADSKTIEVSVNKSIGLNSLFIELEKSNITVTSMRNKTNRLEQLFIQIVKKGKNETV